MVALMTGNYICRELFKDSISFGRASKRSWGFNSGRQQVSVGEKACVLYFMKDKTRMEMLLKWVLILLFDSKYRIVFRGDANEHAVLCTEDSTFEIKEAETSNSLLIFEELAFPEQAQQSSRCSSDSSASSKSPDSVSNLPIIPIGVFSATQGESPGDEDVVLEEEETVVRSVGFYLYLSTASGFWRKWKSNKLMILRLR